MNATLEFDNEDDLRTAIDGARWRNACHDICEWARQQDKYAEASAIDFPTLREKLHEILANNDVRFD